MSKEKFTPGPWRHVINRPPLIMGPEGEYIAVIKRTERCSYNAELIAAAPEMYELLKDLHEDHAEGYHIDLNQAFFDDLVSILKKARGEKC